MYLNVCYGVCMYLSVCFVCVRPACARCDDGYLGIHMCLPMCRTVSLFRLCTFSAATFKVLFFVPLRLCSQELELVALIRVVLTLLEVDEYY